MSKDRAYKTLKGKSLEDAVRRKRMAMIGEAIMKMNYWQRVWWALTGQSKYMLYSYWEKTQ